jgi:hypothetical protein
MTGKIMKIYDGMKWWYIPPGTILFVDGKKVRTKVTGEIEEVSDIIKEKEDQDEQRANP